MQKTNVDPTLQARVPVWMADEANRLAELQGVSISEVLRQALKNHLAKHDVHAPGYINH